MLLTYVPDRDIHNSEEKIVLSNDDAYGFFKSHLVKRKGKNSGIFILCSSSPSSGISDRIENMISCDGYKNTLCFIKSMLIGNESTISTFSVVEIESHIEAYKLMLEARQLSNIGNRKNEKN